MTPRCRRPRVSSLFRRVMSLPAARSIKSCAPTVFFSFHRGGARSNSTPVVHEFGIALPRGLTLVCYQFSRGIHGEVNKIVTSGRMI